MDFLGLRTLTVIQNAVALVNKNTDISDKFDINKIDYNDDKVYELSDPVKRRNLSVRNSGEELYERIKAPQQKMP